jgi:hypothetical protein
MRFCSTPRPGMAQYQHMVHGLRIPIIVVAIASASVVMPAAHADEGQYLKTLQPKYVYLTTQQLLDEGYKACLAAKRGVPGTDTIGVVQNDVAVSVAAAYDIVTTAATRLDC